MPELEFLDSYGGQSLDELLAMEATHRKDSLLLAIESALDAKATRLGPASLTSEERMILAVEALEREVNNGGYHQFFINSSCAYAGEVESALRAIGCPGHADIARRAIDALAIDGPITAESVEMVASECSDELLDTLDSVDQEYYACEESIEERLFTFAESHRDHIRIP